MSVDPPTTAQENNSVQGEAGQAVLLRQEQCNSWRYGIFLRAKKLLKSALSGSPAQTELFGTVYLSLKSSLHGDVEKVKANQLNV